MCKHTHLKRTKPFMVSNGRSPKWSDHRTYAVHPLFLDNLSDYLTQRGEHFDNYFHLNSWLKLYAPQTKILEDRTKYHACLFDAFFNNSLPKSSTHTLEKYIENARPFFCSVVQNLRLGSIELFKMEIREKKGTSGIRLSCSVFQHFHLGHMRLVNRSKYRLPQKRGTSGIRPGYL